LANSSSDICYPRFELIKYKQILKEITEYLSENTYLFDSGEFKEFNLECVKLLIEENRTIRDKLERKSYQVNKAEEELRKVRQLNQYYPKAEDIIIYEGEDGCSSSGSASKKSSSSSRRLDLTDLLESDLQINEKLEEGYRSNVVEGKLTGLVSYMEEKGIDRTVRIHIEKVMDDVMDENRQIKLKQADFQSALSKLNEQNTILRNKYSIAKSWRSQTTRLISSIQSFLSSPTPPSSLLPSLRAFLSSLSSPPQPSIQQVGQI